MTDAPAERLPGPGPVIRLAGGGAVAGAILWPIALSGMATSLVAEAGGSGSGASLNPILPLAIALLLFAAAVAALEYRATTDIGFVDLVGDLSIGMAAVVVTLAAVFGAYDLLGPGFAVLFAGSVIFGAAGLNGARRPRWGSALVATGAGGLLACFVVVAALGASRLERAGADGHAEPSDLRDRLGVARPPPRARATVGRDDAGWPNPGRRNPEP